jgi:hypothetical protein
MRDRFGCGLALVVALVLVGGLHAFWLALR